MAFISSLQNTERSGGGHETHFFSPLCFGWDWGVLFLNRVCVRFATVLPPLPSVHFGDKSCREVKGELLEDEGDTPSILPGESVEEPTLLRLPSSRSGEWQELRSDRLEMSEDSMVVVPWKSLLG